MIGQQSKEREKLRKIIHFKDYSVNLLFAIIPLVGFVVFGLIPQVLSLYFSFNEMTSHEISEATWVGLQNYITLFTERREEFLYTLLTTLIFTTTVPLGIIVSIWIANLVNKVSAGKGFFRTIFFLPYICSMSVIVIAFRFLFDETSGVLNQMLTSMGFMGEKWLTDNPVQFLVCTIILDIWAGSGYKVVLLLAALSKVDKSYYEAAEIDGATESTIFWKITLPAITPTISFLLTMGLIGALQVMTQLHFLCRTTHGVPYWNEDVIYCFYSTSYWMYDMIQNPYTAGGYGLASATGWILGILIFIITQINMKLQERWVCYDF